MQKKTVFGTKHRSRSAAAVWLAEHKPEMTNREIAKKVGIKEQTVCAAIARVVGSRVSR